MSDGLQKIEKLKSEEYDLLVVDGGIYGAFVAWDAVLRGLKVALVEQIVDGGLGRVHPKLSRPRTHHLYRKLGNQRQFS